MRMRTIAYRDARVKFREREWVASGVRFVGWLARRKEREKRAVTRWSASTALFRAYTSPVAAKCREIVILQSQREFTLAAGEI